jgi:hypothetical protein
MTLPFFQLGSSCVIIIPNELNKNKKKTSAADEREKNNVNGNFQQAKKSQLRRQSANGKSYVSLSLSHSLLIIMP